MKSARRRPAPMGDSRPRPGRPEALPDRRKARGRRGGSFRRWLGDAGYLLLGILIAFGWYQFQAFEGLPGALGPVPQGHPMHRVIEAGIVLAVAIVPLAVYGVLQFRAHRRRRRAAE